MVYSKPEVVVLGTAFSSIQGNKQVGIEPLNYPNIPPDSELDD
jgi:hypothetical protein